MDFSARPSRRSRLISGLLAGTLALAAAAAVQVASPAYACACGAFAGPVDADGELRLNSEMSMVSLKEGQERIDMRLAMDSVTPNTGLIVPTPTPATVSMGKPEDFTVLARELTPAVVSQDDWWNTPPDPTRGGAAEPTPPSVLSTVQLGPLEATTLAASDAEGLTNWLAANGYGLPQAVTDLLGHYVDLGWSFVAIKLTSTDPLTGDLDPIRFDFASDKLVYPLVLSKAATVPQVVTLYVFADHRQDVRWAGGGTVPEAKVTWARQVKDLALKERGLYLTGITLTFPDPSRITDDLELVKASTDETVGTTVVRVNYMLIGGIPVGKIIVGLGAFIVVLVLALALIPATRRK